VKNKVGDVLSMPRAAPMPARQQTASEPADAPRFEDALDRAQKPDERAEQDLQRSREAVPFVSVMVQQNAAVNAKPDAAAAAQVQAAVASEVLSLVQAAPQAEKPVEVLQAALPQTIPQMETQTVKTVIDMAPQPAAAAAAPVENMPAKAVLESLPETRPLMEEAKPADAAPARQTLAANLYAAAQAPVQTAVEVETQPVKTIQVPAMEVTGKLGSEINQMAQSGKTMLRIQINPEELGRIEVKLVAEPAGMRVVMTTDQPATGRLLENQMHQLQNALVEAGVKVSGMEVNSQNAGSQFAGSHRDPQLTFATPAYASGRFEEQSQEVALQVTGALSGLDYQV